jgi:hypothetical protein
MSKKDSAFLYKNGFKNPKGLSPLLSKASLIAEIIPATTGVA